ncbi:MAG: hypothetical protein Kow002_06880 [Anaerolineales bacterium]
MKNLSQPTRIAIWLGAGILVILTAIALTVPLPSVQTSAAAGAMIDSTASAAQTSSEVGSTDGIVMLAAVITLIITIPILLRWKDWTRDKK